MRATAIFVYFILSAKALAERSGSGEDDGSGSTTDGRPPPVTEIPPVTYGNLSCDIYNAGGICQQVLYYPVITNYSRVDHATTKQHLDRIFQVLEPSDSNGGYSSSLQCILRAVPLLCYFTFPYCDPAFAIPVYEPICRWDCEVMRDFVCPFEWKVMEKLSPSLQFNSIDRFDCNLLPYSDAGNAPMCISTLDGGYIPLPVHSGGTCYFGDGRGYSGSVDRTSSGYTCQVWTANYPHRSLLSPYQYPELFGGHNYCRNPGGKGERPWCFTTNRTVRWEYCNVPQCDPGPTCQRYTGSLCRTNGSIGMDYIYIDTSIATQKQYEIKLAEVFNTLDNYPECKPYMVSLLCHMTFPLCDNSYIKPRPRKVCYSYCNYVKAECMGFYSDMISFISVYNSHPIVISNCSDNHVDVANGGDNPECYTPLIERDNITIGNISCYNVANKGIDYIGHVNRTVSGIPCQSWSAPIPHIHPFTSLFRRYLEGHNYCRNPEGRGQRPWCYTANASIRWEYCDIPVCSSSPTTDMLLPEYVPPLIGGVGGFMLLILVFICFCCCCCCWYRRRPKSYTLETPPITDVPISDKIAMDYVKPSFVDRSNPLYTRNTQLVRGAADEFLDVIKLPEYNRDKLVYICDLGEGHFGLVIRAEAYDIVPDVEKATVAVKVLKEGASSTTKSEFFREANLMASFDHVNILKLLGVCVEQEPLCMIFEYMEMGDLNNFLRQNTPAHLRSFPCSGPKTLPEGLSVKMLVELSKDIAAGLSYLSKNHYVHRDLATRNCLVGKNLQVKIADFGLSRDVYSSDYFRLGDSELLPVRWMPPEAIMYSKFTVDSDIWSYGVVLWEIFSYGVQPYFGMSNEEVVQYVRNCNVLKRPQGCPQELYDLMLDCWTMNPTDRPNATEISEGLLRWTPDLSAKLEVETKHTDYQNMSTILEWARRSREAVPNYYVLEKDSGENCEEEKQVIKPRGNGYDHLSHYQ